MSKILTAEEALSYKGPDRIVHWKDYLAEKESKEAVVGMGSEFQVFDKRLGIFSPGRVVVVSGYAKNGKTLFAESWVKSMLDTNKDLKAGIFSFEIQPEEMLKKYRLLGDHAIFLPRELKFMDFDWLYNRCLEAKLKNDCGLILLDHLHFLIDMATKQNMSLNIGAFMRRLKFDIAIGLNMGVILIAHQEKAKEGVEASMNGARDSSFIGQESDAFVVVSRRRDFDENDWKTVEKKRPLDYCVLLRKALESNARKASEDSVEALSGYDQGLTTIKIDVSRMSGTFGVKTTFFKDGFFLREV